MNRYFVVFATDKPGMGQVRQSVRPEHRAYLRSPGKHRVTVHLGGPTLDAGGSVMNGTLLVIEADTLDEVKQFVADDPYVRHGIFANIEIRPWQWGLGNPEARG